jgi:hypothetical protein
LDWGHTIDQLVNVPARVSVNSTGHTGSDLVCDSDAYVVAGDSPKIGKAKKCRLSRCLGLMRRLDRHRKVQYFKGL